MVRVDAHIDGDLRAILEEARDEAADALRQGMRRASDRVQADLRTQTRAAGLGGKLEKAWRVQLYPSRASTRTLRPAGLVYSNATLVHDAFIEGATITARRGRYLVIPTREAEAMGFARTAESRKGGPIPGGQLRRAARYRAAIDKLGPENIRDIPLAGGRRLIVYRVPQGRGQGRTVRARGGGVAFRRGADVPLFILVPQVRLAPRLDFAGAQTRAEAVLEAEMGAALAAGGGG